MHLTLSRLVVALEMSLYNVLDLNDISLAVSVRKKCDGIIQYKLRQLSLLQSAIDSSKKLREPFYYDTTRSITKCDRYYAVRWNANGQTTTIPRFHIMWLSHNQSQFHGTPLKSTYFQLTLLVLRQVAQARNMSIGVGDSLLLPLTSIPEKENNGSKRLSPTPSVSNLSLRPCRYLCVKQRIVGREK